MSMLCGWPPVSQPPVGWLEDGCPKAVELGRPPPDHGTHLQEIRTRCDALKLNSTGKKEKLIQRHRTYTLLFNANLDATNPKSEEELKKEVMRKEGGILAEAQSSMFNGVNGPSVREPIKSDPTIGQRINKKTDPGLIDKVLKDYEVSHMKQFSDLIAKAKMAASKDKEAREIAVAKPLPMALEDQAQEQQKLQVNSTIRRMISDTNITNL
jgi:hypothetical protein